MSKPMISKSYFKDAISDTIKYLNNNLRLESRMSCIKISLNKKEINDIMSSLTVACGQSNCFNGTKKMFVDKCIEQGVTFDKQLDDDYYHGYWADIEVNSMPIYQNED